jgi:hypothetical protein
LYLYLQIQIQIRIWPQPCNRPTCAIQLTFSKHILKLFSEIYLYQLCSVYFVHDLNPWHLMEFISHYIIIRPRVRTKPLTYILIIIYNIALIPQVILTLILHVDEKRHDNYIYIIPKNKLLLDVVSAPLVTAQAGVGVGRRYAGSVCITSRTDS